MPVRTFLGTDIFNFIELINQLPNLDPPYHPSAQISQLEQIIDISAYLAPSEVRPYFDGGYYAGANRKKQVDVDTEIIVQIICQILGDPLLHESRLFLDDRFDRILLQITANKEEACNVAQRMAKAFDDGDSLNFACTLFLSAHRASLAGLSGATRLKAELLIYVQDLEFCGLDSGYAKALMECVFEDEALIKIWEARLTPQLVANLINITNQAPRHSITGSPIRDLLQQKVQNTFRTLLQKLGDVDNAEYFGECQKLLDRLYQNYNPFSFEKQLFAEAMQTLNTLYAMDSDVLDKLDVNNRYGLSFAGVKTRALQFCRRSTDTAWPKITNAINEATNYIDQTRLVRNLRRRG